MRNRNLALDVSTFKEETLRDFIDFTQAADTGGVASVTSAQAFSNQSRDSLRDGRAAGPSDLVANVALIKAKAVTQGNWIFFHLEANTNA